MAKKLGFIIVMLSMYLLLIVNFAHAQEESPSPAVSLGRESLTDSPLPSPEGDSSLPPSFSPEADSPKPPASSPAPETQADSPSPSLPPPQAESPSDSSQSPSSPGPAPVPAPADDDDDDDDDSDPETEYFPSPAPSPAPDVGMPDDIKASEEDGDEYEDNNGEDSGMSALTKAGIAIGAILGVGAMVIGALVYKKRKDNMTRARYTRFTEGEFL
ncbi:hypothetical protein CARUB_v10025454mg [Capsella rubella]|uniref:Uncharacterized protein n=1 Tax=Capsella rubella TaxID=81985 RepID=R0G1A7_9BRAS|nr:vegetative cell wall protein gp1 [Capsella rubella]EOA29182.1 hypothetical protein CARUB_v10025454mg [Capsella rubella]